LTLGHWQPRYGVPPNSNTKRLACFRSFCIHALLTSVPSSSVLFRRIFALWRQNKLEKIGNFHVLCKFEKFAIKRKKEQNFRNHKFEKKQNVAQQALLLCIHILFFDYTGRIHPPGSICSIMTSTGTSCNCLATFKRSKLSRSLLVVAYELSSSFLSWPWLSTLVRDRLDIRSADCPSSSSICICSIWSSLEVW
jgi:hypothetical protein